MTSSINPEVHNVLPGQRTGINGESTSMVWPTLGSRTAKEQEHNVLLFIRGRPSHGDKQHGGHKACENLLADRQTSRHAHRNILYPYRAGTK